MLFNCSIKAKILCEFMFCICSSFAIQLYVDEEQSIIDCLGSMILIHVEVHYEKLVTLTSNNSYMFNLKTEHLTNKKK